MNFSSFKYFAFKNTKFSFNKTSFKMMSSNVNRANCRFVSLFSNKVHIVDRIRTLNNITKKGISGKVATGNGMNIYNDPEISTSVMKSNSLICESFMGCGFNMTSNYIGMMILNDFLILGDGNLILILK